MNSRGKKVTEVSAWKKANIAWLRWDNVLFKGGGGEMDIDHGDTEFYCSN